MKNTHTIILTLAILFGWLLLVPPKTGLTRELTLVYSNDVNGETEPCG